MPSVGKHCSFFLQAPIQSAASVAFGAWGGGCWRYPRYHRHHHHQMFQLGLFICAGMFRVCALCLFCMGASSSS